MRQIPYTGLSESRFSFHTPQHAVYSTTQVLSEHQTEHDETHKNDFKTQFHKKEVTKVPK